MEGKFIKRFPWQKIIMKSLTCCVIKILRFLVIYVGFLNRKKIEIYCWVDSKANNINEWKSLAKKVFSSFQLVVFIKRILKYFFMISRWLQIFNFSLNFVTYVWFFIFLVGRGLRLWDNLCEFCPQLSDFCLLDPLGLVRIIVGWKLIGYQVEFEILFKTKKWALLTIIF
jgi:hypothetical protein